MRCSTLCFAVGAVVLVCAACERAARMAPCSTPAPPVNVDPLNPADRQRIVQYARGLEFEPDSSPTGEKRYLTVKQRENFVTGPVVGAAPAKCSYRNRSADLAFRSGRIVARLVASGPYQKLGLPKDTSYLWVDSVGNFSDSIPAVKPARGVIIPVNPGDSVKVLRVRIDQHGPGYGRSFAEARLVFDPADDYVWESCVMYGCCYVSGHE